MMNEKIYEALENEFRARSIDEDVEEVLLSLCEGLADMQIMDKEVKLTESYGKTKIKAVGICSMEDEEVYVLLKRIYVEKKEFEIEDYFL